jgi:hypothetical protein
MDLARLKMVAEEGCMSPPTIASLRSMGVGGFRVTCSRADCLHSVLITFGAANVADEDGQQEAASWAAEGIQGFANHSR